MQENTYLVNGVNLNVWESGPENGPVIIFLHGFPEAGFAWMAQLLYFEKKGYRVLAPDQRGYNKSSRPQHAKAYRIKHLVQDAVSLITTITNNKVIVVGHDWGGGVAWHLAMQYPQLLERLIILNMPHPAVMHRMLQESGRQRMRSSYALFFQLPFVPEWVCRLRHFKLLERTLQRTSLPHTFGSTQLTSYKKAWSRPGALTGMINWYRAYKFLEAESMEPIALPTLIIWGIQDFFLLPQMADASAALCTDVKLVMLKEATHWLHHEQPDKLARLIDEFIS
jgi:pimeloyl-ACP methyl ester carboxylesterase